jgi:FKBP-type peptidyl-prolyl cis-trans isomerase FkpA
MKKSFMFLALASLGLGLASCNSGFKKTDGGLLYDIHTSKGNPTIKPGDFISLNVVIKTDGDSVLMSTYDAGHSQQMVAAKPMSKFDVFNGIEMMGEGDSATFKVPADSVFKKPGQRPPGFKGNYLVFDIKILKVIAKGTLTQQAFEAQINAYMIKQMAVLKDAEPAKITKYIAHEKLSPIVTKDSLFYQITQPGNGPVVAAGDTVVINYTGRFFNGTIFDSSIKDSAEKAKKVMPGRPYAPIHVVAGMHQVIPGWDEGMLLLNKGAKAKFILPSKLAYGQQGAQQVIGPYTPLEFDLEVVNIIHPNPNAPKPAALPVFPPHPQAAPTAQPQQAPVKK